MVTTTCDICKKKIDNPLTGRSFHYYATHSICEACKDSLELQVKTTLREKDPYATEWYEKYIDDQISKAIQKGKI
ncbi:MAG: hypothetical protein FWC21_00290 [Treponema sp.]|nr:hypothetical protein [Treponema sp.]